MWESEQSVHIQAPVEQVYGRLKDFTRHSDFAESLITVEQVTSGPVDVGTRFRALERVPREFASTCEITALEEPRVIAWKARVEGVMRTEWEFRLSPSATGGTDLTQISRWQATGPLGFLMLNLHRKRNAERENRRTLDRIKAVLEAERAAEEVAA
jgi:uncharacterized protein YndB with AHSA1/START domain